MSSTPTPISLIFQSRPGDLAEVYRRLTDALTRSGLSGVQRSEILAQHVAVQCAACGLRLTGEQLGAWAALGPEAKPADPMLARLRLGYCGRVGCESWSYDVELSDCPEVDWNRLRQAVVGTGSAPVRQPKRRSLTWLLPPIESRTLIRLGLGLAIVLGLLLVRYRMNGGRIPILEPEHHYRLAPSLEPGPAKR